jgi:hypothetical protein
MVYLLDTRILLSLDTTDRFPAEVLHDIEMQDNQVYFSGESC